MGKLGQLAERQRGTIRKTATPQLREGEQIQAAIAAQTALGPLAALRNGFRAVVVSDQRILIFRTGVFKVHHVKELLAELARNTEIGEPSGLWWHCKSLGPEALYIGRPHHDEVRVADKARTP